MKTWASPNIAFIKYWGKLPSTSDETRNLGTNPSISLTLSKARTTVVTEKLGEAGPAPVPDDAFRILIEGAPASEADRRKLIAHLRRVESYAHAGFGRHCPPLSIDSRNNFPLGAGIASSASSFAALTLAFLAETVGTETARRLLDTRAADLSALARRGSGSACRSIYGGLVKWDGEHAQPLPFEWPLRDTIVILSRDKKKISSTDGHAAALSSPRFADRLARLPSRIRAVEAALQARRLDALGPLLEEEALEMHAVARSGEPPADYLLPPTWRFLEALAPQRERDYFFTIDAGPNLHFLSERPVAAELRATLARLGLEGEIWEDEAGTGPQLA